MQRTSINSALLLLLLTCAWSLQAQPPSSATTSDLSGPTWQLLKFQGGDGKTLAPTGNAKYTLIFTNDGHVNAQLDCNRGRGMWKSSARNQLEFGPLALTRAMCPPGSLDTQIAAQLSNVRSYTLKGGHLFLSLMADGGTYEFEPTKSGAAAGKQPTTSSNAAAPLEGTYWKLTYLGDTSVDTGSLQKEPNLIFRSDSHRVSGTGGCNNVSGSYQLSGDQLTFGQMASTMMACAKGMETERSFLEALSRVKQWKIKGQELTLLDADGKQLLRFEARAA